MKRLAYCLGLIGVSALMTVGQPTQAGECFSEVTPGRVHQMSLTLRRIGLSNDDAFWTALQAADESDELDRASLRAFISQSTRALGVQRLHDLLEQRSTEQDYFRLRSAAVMVRRTHGLDSPLGNRAHRLLQATAFLLSPYRCLFSERAEVRARRQARRLQRASRSTECHAMVSDHNLRQIQNHSICTTDDPHQLRYHPLRLVSNEQDIDPARVRAATNTVCSSRLALESIEASPRRKRSFRRDLLLVRGLVEDVADQYPEARDFLEVTYPLLELQGCQRRELGGLELGFDEQGIPPIPSSDGESEVVADDEPTLLTDDEPTLLTDAEIGARSDSVVTAELYAALSGRSASLEFDRFVEDMNVCRSQGPVADDESLSAMIEALTHWRELEEMLTGSEVDASSISALRRFGDPQRSILFAAGTLVATDASAGSSSARRSCAWLGSRLSLDQADRAALGWCYVENRPDALILLRNSARHRGETLAAAARFYRRSRVAANSYRCSSALRRVQRFCADQRRTAQPLSVEALDTMIREVRRIENPPATYRRPTEEEAAQAVDLLCSR
jgi:hypothetical protein